MKRFTEGNCYYGRFICNADHIVCVEIVKRTAKTVLVGEIDRPHETTPKRRRIKEGRDSELITLGPGISIFADKELQ